MSQPLRVKRELHAIVSKQETLGDILRAARDRHINPPQTLLAGKPWNETNNAASHSDIRHFAERMRQYAQRVKERT